MINQYTIIINDLAEFQDLFDISKTNMEYYFSNFLNDGLKVKQEYKRLELTGLTIGMYSSAAKDCYTEYSDIRDKTDRVYNEFIHHLLQQAHVRTDFVFYDYLKYSSKKANLKLINESNKPSIKINYCTQPIMVSFHFQQDGLKIIYKYKNNKKIEININSYNVIVSTKLSINGKVTDINLSHKQIDYLILLCHYGVSEDNDFDANQYITDILNNDFKQINDYIQLKEMTFI